MMCGECKRACPQQIEIPTMLRCRDYYYQQLADRELAIEMYQTIPVERRFDAVCSLCGNCEKVCPNDIRIVHRLREASDVLESLVV